LITIAMNFLTILADGAAAPPAGGATPNAAPGFGGLMNSPMFPIFLIVIIFMVFQFMSKRKQDKQRQGLLNQMKRGDRVRTIGGILGTIVEVRDGEVVVKVDESNNTKIKFTRTAIATVVTEEEKVEAK
jgi:preprotein translocase subunit YajC